MAKTLLGHGHCAPEIRQRQGGKCRKKLKPEILKFAKHKLLLPGGIRPPPDPVQIIFSDAILLSRSDNGNEPGATPPQHCNKHSRPGRGGGHPP